MPPDSQTKWLIRYMMRDKAQNGYNSRSPWRAQTVLCTYPTTYKWQYYIPHILY